MPGIAEIPNPEHQIPNEIQKLKVRNQNDKVKLKTFNLCSVILHFYFYILKGVFRVYLCLVSEGGIPCA